MQRSDYFVSTVAECVVKGSEIRYLKPGGEDRPFRSATITQKRQTVTICCIWGAELRNPPNARWFVELKDDNVVAIYFRSCPIWMGKGADCLTHLMKRVTLFNMVSHSNRSLLESGYSFARRRCIQRELLLLSDWLEGRHSALPSVRRFWRSTLRHKDALS